MGVSGSGKSTVGAALAQRLRVPFVDADTLHPAANIAKMAAGEPLDDDDRYPWLEQVGDWLATHRAGHFMPAALLRSQLDTLEPLGPDEAGMTLDIGPDVDAIVDTVVKARG
jgi:gluconokinase